jgi:Zn finger protein HypA/HybF involved in hydrogenase expression
MEKNQFKVICESCGSLTIALPSEAETAPFIVLKCGRCGSPRGTLQALREMSVSARHIETLMQDGPSLNRHWLPR